MNASIDLFSITPKHYKKQKHRKKHSKIKGGSKSNSYKKRWYKKNTEKVKKYNMEYYKKHGCKKK